MAKLFPALNKRPVANTICLFDIDYTLTLPRQSAKPEILTVLSALRQKVTIGYVSGSDFVKQQEQLGTSEVPVTSLFDFCFAENGLTAYKSGVPLASQSFINWFGESKYKVLVRFLRHYIADLDIPIKRGTFVEFRNGMINFSPIGRNASLEERDEFERYHKEHRVRMMFVAALRDKFAEFNLTYSIGGQISFDIFPPGWDKTYCLQNLENEAKILEGINYATIHFFGDRKTKGGNDSEIYSDSRTIGHSVIGPEDTAAQLKKLFNI